MLQLDAADPPGRLAQWLDDAGLDVQVVDLAAGAPVPALDDAAGLVVLGGTMSHDADVTYPFLPAVRAALRAAVSTELPTLAVCLGAQLLAVANGGRVVPNPEGPELGAQLVAKRANAANDPLFRPLPIAPDVIQWHYDTIATLPPGALHLASSPVCEHQAFRLGRLAWGVQFHIETTPEVVRGWARADAPDLADYDLDRILARAEAVHEDIEQTWQPFAAEFAALVRDPSSAPAARGIATSTAEPITDPAAIRAALAAELGAARSPLPMPTLRPRQDG